MISPCEVETFINQTTNNQNNVNTALNLSHILIPFPRNPTLDQILEMENLTHLIIKQAQDGKELDRLIAVYSTNRRLIEGGKIGWTHIQDLPSAFYQTFSLAKKGDIIGPIRSSIGFHILKVHDILYGQNKNLFTKEVHIRHILLRPSVTITNDQIFIKLENMANNIRRKKMSFSYAARKFSQDLYSSNHGGDLGWSPLGMYDSVICKELINMKKGQISRPIHSSFGWHIIELLDIRNTDKIKQKKYAYRILFNRKLSEELDIWMKEKLANTYVKILSN